MKFLNIFKKKKKYIPPTYEQMQGFLSFMTEVTQEQVKQKKAFIELNKMLVLIVNENQETKAAIDLLFSRLIELEQAVQNAGFEIPRAKEIVN